MKLIKPSTKILTSINGEEVLKSIEIAARTCNKSEGKIKYTTLTSTPELVISHATSARVLIKKLLNRGHEAMLEFGTNITVKFICDRGVSHELVRHRIASFAQESTRYCNYNKDEHIVFIIPEWLTGLQEDIYTFDNITYTNSGHIGYNTWLKAMLEAEKYYNILSIKGWSHQQARLVLPNSVKTEINIDANIREWRHIFKLRTNAAAHSQMRELMIPLLKEFKNKIPVLFDDINN